jgi:hypothetical protein
VLPLASPALVLGSAPGLVLAVLPLLAALLPRLPVLLTLLPVLLALLTPLLPLLPALLTVLGPALIPAVAAATAAALFAAVPAGLIAAALASSPHDFSPSLGNGTYDAARYTPRKIGVTSRVEKPRSDGLPSDEERSFWIMGAG